ARSQAPVLRTALKDVNPFAQLAAASLVVKVDTDAKAKAEAISVLGELALKDDRQLREPAAELLFSLGAEARPALPGLLKVMARGPRYRTNLGTGDPTYEMAIKTVQIQGKEAIPLLVAALADDNVDLRNAAFEALAGMHAQASDALPALRL